MTTKKSTTAFDAAKVMEAAAESILITTGDFDAPGPTIIYVNPAFEKMTGWVKEEVVGKSPRILQGPKTDLGIFVSMRERLLAENLWEGLTVNYRKDGSEFWMEWSIVPVSDDSKKKICYVAVQRDVSARIESERRLRQAEAAEKVAERARANLARYFPPKLMTTLAEKDHPLGAVRKQNLAVLFADVVGFTKLSEDLEPEQVIEILRDIHKWTQKVIFKYDGSIEGYIGDAILAIFGFPEAKQTDAGNALACAYELHEEAAAWNKKREAIGLKPVRIGIGLEYGPVVLGDVGTKDYVEFTVVGDTVNTASRLQQVTRNLNCDLVAGQGLVENIRNEQSERSEQLFRYLQPHGPFNVRGRSEPVDIWTWALPPQRYVLPGHV
jgi:PAS domain S-box-containing protein